jgi:hypothetical protein
MTNTRLLVAIGLMLGSAPALAGESRGAATRDGHGARAGAGHATAVPEPADMMLFGAGIAGLLIGRRSSRARRRSSERQGI